MDRKFSKLNIKSVHSDSLLKSKRWKVYKHVQDVILTLFLITCLSPLLMLIAIWIKIDSPGPILFCQNRRGYKNKQFCCFKFRTMYHTSKDVDAKQQSVRNDPRVTNAGRVLRRLSLDELPQLFNVLIGNMALVGPRPHTSNTGIEGRLLVEVADNYLLRYNVKPGITGWAQMNGARGILDSEEKLHRRLLYDFYYIDNWTPALDIKILFKTLNCTFDENAY